VALGILIWGATAQGYGEVGSRGKALVGGLGKFPGSWSSLQTLFAYFDCRNDQKFGTFCTFNTLILDQSVELERG